MTDTPELLLAHHLKTLRLPTFLREHDKQARICAAEGVDHLRYLARLNEKMFDSLDDARRKLALWRYDYNNVRPHSSLGIQTPAEAHRTLEQCEGSTPGALAQTETQDYENQTRRLSL